MSKKSQIPQQNITDTEMEANLKNLLAQQERLAEKIDHLVFNWLYLNHDFRRTKSPRESGGDSV